MRHSLRLLIGALLMGASMLPARGMEAADTKDAPSPSAVAQEDVDDGVPEREPTPPALVAGRDTQWSDTRTPMPFDVMRSVQFLQDQVAHGNDRAIRVQALLLRRFGRSFLEADPAVWQDPRNIRAVILFTLSGGTPDVIERLIRDGLFPETERPLFEGARDYVRNDLEKAGKKLDGVAVDELEPILGAQISLALGQIHQFDQPEKAISHLERARLLAPGTLIEEAALRLGAPLVDAQARHVEADRLARRYFDRYGNSSYAANFEARYVAMLVGRAISDAQSAIASMDAVIDSLSPDRRLRLYLAAARRSLVTGNLGFAKLSAERAIALGDLAPGDAARGELYRTAAALGDGDPVASRSRLEAIDREALHAEDRKLLDAALSVLSSMVKPALMSEADLGASEDANRPSVLSRARQALDAASRQIETSKP